MNVFEKRCGSEGVLMNSVKTKKGLQIVLKNFVVVSVPYKRFLKKTTLF